jgi:hypothetical protein
MRFALTASGVLLVATFVAAGNEGPEALAGELVKNLKELTATLGTIKDVKTAEVARPRLVTLGKRLLELRKKMEGPEGEPKDKQAAAKLREKYGKELAEVGRAFRKEAERVDKLPGVKAVLKDTPLLAFLTHQDQARRDRAKIDVRNLSLAADAYKVFHGEYPESLQKLTEKQPGGGQPFVEMSALIDPWGRPYVYDAGTLDQGTGRPLIYSQGPHPGDAASRIRNWEAAK